MTLEDWPADYGYVFTRPVNWDCGPMDELDAMWLSRRTEQRPYLVVWECRTERVGFKNGNVVWRKKLPNQEGV